MTDWMMETLLWTAVLIAFVLLIRRPVSRSLGPQTAYALWALPALRLILPPIELPAWMRLLPENVSDQVAVPEELIATAFELPVARSESEVAAHPAASDPTASRHCGPTRGPRGSSWHCCQSTSARSALGLSAARGTHASSCRVTGMCPRSSNSWNASD